MLQKTLAIKKHVRQLARTLVAVMLFIALTIPASGPVQGASITVTTFKDELNSNGNCSLREAIQAANTDRRVDRCPAGSGTDTIYLKEGTYQLTIPGQHEDANRTGDFDILKPVKISGAGRTVTFIEANKLDRIFDVHAGISVEMRNLTVQHGRLEGGNDVENGGGIRSAGNLTLYKVRASQNFIAFDMFEMGGGLYSAGNLTVTDSVFDGNYTAEYGSAIGGSGTMKILRTRFEGNSAFAGTIYISGQGSVAELEDSKMVKNGCGAGEGSAFEVAPGSVLKATRVVFDSNRCMYQMIYNQGELLIRYSTFLNSTVDGAPLIGNYGGKLTLLFNTFINSSTAGGLLEVDGGSVFIDRTTFQDDFANGFHVKKGTLRMTNSTLSALHGRVFTVTGGRLELVNVTSANHQGEQPQLVMTGGEASIHNSILANTTAPDGQPLADCRIEGGALQSLGYNIISRGDGCSWPAAAGDQIGTLAAPVDPKLGPLANNGGSTFTHALLDGSPAIDTADPAMCFRSDQRLVTRPQGPRCDIGAYEKAVTAAPALEFSPDALPEEPLP